MIKKSAPYTTSFEMAFVTAAFKTTAFVIPTAVNGNDDLYNELERRYGEGYAQDIVAGLKRSQKN